MSTEGNRNLRDGFGLSVYLTIKLKLKTSIVKSMIKGGSVAVNGIVTDNTRHPVYVGDIVSVKGRII